MKRNASAAGWLVVICLAVAPLPCAAALDCERVYAVGDLHGGDEAFVELLSELELVDETLNWIGDDDCLVQTGDVVDRGAGARRLLDILMRLHAESDGRVQMLLGNHEIMNMLGDLRYVSAGEFASFAADETPAERDAGYAAFLETETQAAVGLSPDDARREFDERYPPGWFAHRRAFAPDGPYGAWLLERPVVTTIGATAFVHGGLSSADAARGPEDLTARVHAEVRQYHRLRKRLVEAGWLGSLTPFSESYNAIAERLDRVASGNGMEHDLVRDARQFLALCRDATGVRSDGPVWNRMLAQADEVAFAEQLRTILESAGVERIVVGHTTTPDGRIDARFRKRVFVIDTGAGPAYAGRISALEITRAGRVSAVYLGERDVFAEPPRDETAIERFLRDGLVIDSKEIGSGITRPLRLTIELEGKRMRAAFKHLHERRMEITRWRGRQAEFNFTDSYRYERAAYLLDRWLGIEMVPVAVIRDVDEAEGAVIEWVEDAMTEATREANGAPLLDPAAMVRQRALMRLFDALIANDDRNLGNQLITPDGRLHLIDHTRSFRERRKLPEAFADAPISLPSWLLPRLEALDRPTLDRVVGDLLGSRQKKRLLERRDALVRKIAAERQRYGDGIVFFAEEPRRVPAEAATTN